MIDVVLLKNVIHQYLLFDVFSKPINIVRILYSYYKSNCLHTHTHTHSLTYTHTQWQKPIKGRPVDTRLPGPSQLKHDNVPASIL